jgi:N-acetyl-anhydromuramyl-L-alanine amidase AmpD
MDALTDEEEAAFQGVLGHHHLQADKRDPGPAFDWERFLRAARAPGEP